MNNCYTEERNFQMLISILKAHNIRTIIASPGTTNVAFVASIQGDPFFEIFSAPDERSAAYMACGYAEEKNVPVVITCTGATASRNYLPGLTEAYYRKLPIIALTSTRHPAYVDQLTPQVIDRTSIQNDVAVLSVQIPAINTTEDALYCNLKLNEAILATTHRGGGPVHINIVGELNNKFTAKQLPETRIIQRYSYSEVLPSIDFETVGIYVGNHLPFTKELEEVIALFCERYNACVLCDHTSNYHGKYAVQYNLVADQKKHKTTTRNMNLLIDIGAVSGAYMSLKPKEVWRISDDGKIQGRYSNLKKVFEMNEKYFFDSYVRNQTNIEKKLQFFNRCKNEYCELLERIHELPFSNIWIASEMSKCLPDNCNVHLAILNTLRSWNFFELNSSINCYSNTGGFGIDGTISTLLGCSLANKDKMNYCIVGDLAFFYDMNALGNRHIGNNIRILLINNGVGTEFRNYSHLAYQFGEDANEFIAAAGHYGNKSKKLVRHYAEDLGFKYYSATSKEEFKTHIGEFVSVEKNEYPMLFEVFTNDCDESDALRKMNHLLEDAPTATDKAKTIAKGILGEKGIDNVKKLLKR